MQARLPEFSYPHIPPPGAQDGAQLHGLHGSKCDGLQKPPATVQIVGICNRNAAPLLLSRRCNYQTSIKKRQQPLFPFRLASSLYIYIYQ